MTAVAEKPTGRPWWMTLVMGIASILVGAVLLFGSLDSRVNLYMLLITLVGVWWLIDGVMNLVSMFMDHRMWGWKLFMGIIGILAGGWILVYPVYAAILLPQIFVLVLGIYGLMEGIMLLIMAFRGAGWGAGILGAVALVFGGILLANYSSPGMGLSFIWAAAVLAFIGGFFMVVRAFRER